MEATRSKFRPQVDYYLPIDKALCRGCLAPLSAPLWETKTSQIHITVIKPRTARQIHTLNNFLFTITSSHWNFANSAQSTSFANAHFISTLHLNKLRQINIYFFGKIILDAHLHFIMYYARTSVTRRLAQIQTKHHIYELKYREN
jgi:hypothetical protein